MESPETEDQKLRSAALQNAASILAARHRAEEELLGAKEALERKSAELAHSLSMIRATLESTTDGIIVTDDAGRVTDYNESYVRMWRIPPELMATRDHQRLRAFLAEQFTDPAAVIAGVERIYAAAPAETLDELELADGRVYQRLSRMQVVDDRSVGRVWSFRDITDRRRNDQEHAYLAAIIASSTDAIVSKTLEGIVTSWNEAAERIFGYSAAEMVGQHITTIIPPERINEEQLIINRLKRGERVEHFDSIRMRKDGTRIHVSLTISPVIDSTGRIIGASKIVRDTTERELLLAREQAARARAEEASRLKDEFLATVSHELRTPLNAILGWAQLLRSGRLDPAKAVHAAEVVERNARTQAQVIDDLLDVSRIITGKLRLNIGSVMPAAAVESALDSVRFMAEAKGIRVVAMLDPQAGPISGDAGRLQQIAWNLLSNAIKFTPRGGRVEVRVERIDSHIELVVSDSGQGIEPEFLPNVFDRFRQADASSSRTISGLGLGLSIVRHLVELHGGVVTASSAGLDCGSTFAVKLPLRPLQALQDERERVHPRVERHSSFLPMEKAPRLVGVRVLIVDDEPDTRDMLREVLEQCGAEVRDAGSARQAFEQVQEWRPSVLVSDIGMPEEDGYSLIRSVRQWEKISGTWIPAVALTAYARVEDRMQALIAGYQVHVAKPIEPAEFALVVAGLIQPAPPLG